MRKFFFTQAGFAILLVAPLSAFAAEDALFKYIGNITRLIIQPLILLMFAFAMFYLVVGATKLVLKADDPKARETGRRMLIWGIVGFFIMVTAVTILEVVTNTFCGTPFCK